MVRVDHPSEAGLLAAERALHAAQLAGDVAALDRLLHDRLIAIGPDGARHTKNDDLAGYRSGFSVITEMSEEDVEVLVAGSTGATFFTAPSRERSAGAHVGAAAVHADVGVRRQAGWRILAAHIAVEPSP